METDDIWVCPKCGTKSSPYREVVQKMRLRYMYILSEGKIVDWVSVPYLRDSDGPVDYEYIGCTQCDWYKDIS